MPKRDNLVGQRFGRLTVTSKAEAIGTSSMRWNCICDCGKRTIVYGHFLKSGHTRSCGCLSEEAIGKRNRKHGMVGTRLYSIWHGMKRRCLDANDAYYSRYGGRGICICAEWQSDFRNFAEWALTNGYTDSLTIDRIDNDGNYCPENCRWVDGVTQSNNKSNNRLVTANGQTHTVSEWARILGINDSTLCARLDRGWSDEETINKPLKKHRRHKNESTHYQ